MIDIKNSRDVLGQDCWRKIGIWSNSANRCEKLDLVKHCRNCDVFKTFTQDAMLERTELLNEQSLSMTGHLGLEINRGNRSIMPFRMGSVCFAVASCSVITISDQVSVHSIPYSSSSVIKGLVAINHEVYTFIDFSSLLELGVHEYGAKLKKHYSLYNRTLVVSFASRTVAFCIDEVYQIHRYFDEDIEPLKQKLSGAKLLSGTKLLSGSKLLSGIISDSGAWCSDCYLLNLDLVAEKLKALPL